MNWPTVKIREVAEVVSGYGFPHKHQGQLGEEFPFYKVGDMNTEGNEIRMTVAANTISEETLHKLKARAFPAGTVIFPKIGAAIATNKKRMLTQPSVVDNNVMGFVPCKYIDEWYLFYWMQQFDLRTVSNAGPVPSMRKSEVERLSIPYPPRSEQVRIVQILRQADELWRKRDVADDKARRILTTLFHSTFGDPSSNPRGWPKKRLDEVVEIGTTLVDPNQPEYVDMPHVGGEHIEKGTGRLLSLPLVRDSQLRSAKFTFTDQHILYSKIRPYLNKVAFPKCDGVCSADIYPLRSKDTRIGPWFLIALLRSQAFLAYSSVHSGRLRMPKLNRDQLGSYEIPLPPPDLTAAFERQAQQIADMTESMHEAASRIQRLSEVLLHRAFRGELTALWRSAHEQELKTEMQAQMAALEEGNANKPKRGRNQEAVD